jgi:hypothetical protein
MDRTTINTWTSLLEPLVRTGFLAATVETDGESAGEYGYIVTERGLRYYEMADQDDPVARLIERFMLAALTSD